ncbi:MAG: cytochrome c oxidase accessory protein CcoG [Crocinitomicaceae bacterium]|nr:cytochrome c oxidase accessory protein CcoG [Crocinitomicaceae bacterium]
MSEEQQQEEAFRDRIATVNEKGKRIWVFPKKPKGRFYDRRKILSYFLLALIFIGPFIKIGEEPLLMLNIIKRKFVIFGQVFWPAEAYLFALGTIIMVVVVILFTLIFGRLFCGWVCPQTIFMEMLFRRIEYAIDGDWTEQKRLAKMPFKGVKLRKRLLKWFIFYAISFVIANFFLMYIIGYEEVFQIITDNPQDHVVGLIAIVAFSTVFFFVFLSFREQVCTVVCPYGRLQGVLLDKNSMVVAYDYVRGEKEKGRAKFNKKEDRATTGKGDCIDCGQCVHVCPTGIDIRNGTQLECVNCTACIDACDHMMDGVGMDRGLIRFASETQIKEGKKFKWSLKVKAYSAVMTILVIVFGILIFTRDDLQTKFQRVRGTTFTKAENGMITNMFKVNFFNKTNKDMNIQLEIDGVDAELYIIGDSIIVPKGDHYYGQIMIKADRSVLQRHKTPMNIKVFANGTLEETYEISFLGPK